MRGVVCPLAVGAGAVRFTTRDLPASAGPEPVGLGVEDALASSAPSPAAPEAEQHHGTHHCAWGLLHERPAKCRRVGPQIVDVTQIDGVVAVVEMGLERRVTLRRL